MSCGCASNFDGDMTSDNELGGFDNFDGDMASDNELGGFDNGLSFDGELDEFDNFLTKKMRARNKRKKELKTEGLTRQEAKQKALEEIPRDSLKQVIANIKNRKKGDSGINLTDEQKQAITDGGINAVTTALNNSGGNTTMTDGGFGGEGDGMPNSDDENQAGFFKKNGIYIGIGAVVLIGGYFAWKKGLFGGNKGK